MEVYKGKDRSKKQCWRWRLRGKDGKIIGRSEEPFNRSSIVKAILAVGRAARRGVFEYYVDKVGGWRWRLYAANKEVVAISSGGYPTRKAAQAKSKEFRALASGRRVCKA